MAHIVKEQTFERDEDNGGGVILQRCEYNSVSNMVTIDTDGHRLTLPTTEWRLLFNLINKSLEMKGQTL